MELNSFLIRYTRIPELWNGKEELHWFSAEDFISIDPIRACRLERIERNRMAYLAFFVRIRTFYCYTFSNLSRLLTIQELFRSNSNDGIY